MSELQRSHVEGLLEKFVDPLTEEDLVASRSVTGIGIDGDRVAVDLQLGYPAAGIKDDIEKRVREHLESDDQISAAVIHLQWKVVPHKVQKDLTPMPGVKNVIAVASGKGGVGKSTTSVNLALALVAEGASVGLMDADIYGPSLQRMMGLSGKPESRDGQSIEPKFTHGVQSMSIGLMVEEDTPMVWRGPMVTQALQQLLFETHWHGLDYLIIDLPPGTGDIQLTLAQKVPVSGAVIVTTPQDIALLDARKGLKMFDKVGIPVLGVLENMSTHVCSECGHEEHIFGSGGGASISQQYDVELLGSLPLDIRIREQTDGGKPTVIAEPDSEIAAKYREVARRVAAKLSVQARNLKIQFPNIVIQNT